MVKQTAVNWFNQQLVERQNGDGDSRSWDEILQQALQMEREQKIEFAKKCLDNALDLDIRTAHSKVEDYYNKTYGGNNDN